MESRVLEAFKQQYGESEAIQITSAPGRVNVIGEHTDYNDGFVFPVAIDKYVTMAGAVRKDQRVSVYSLDMGEVAEFSLDAIKPDNEHPWANYIAGVVDLFQKKGFVLTGMNLAFAGNIPIGAGLSSSAALEMATAYQIKRLHQIEISPIEIIKLCQQAENLFVGVNCGIMDQYISCLGQTGHALLIDCRSLEAKPVAILNSGIRLVVANTNVKHSLVESEYNQRRRECEQALRLIGELIGEQRKTLRDVTVEEFQQYCDKLPQLIRQRAEHVIYENQRVNDGLNALAEGNLHKFGDLMKESHRSLRDLYQVSCPELDLLVDLASQIRGVYGSRMTGGGFGGCSVSLIETEQVNQFVSDVGEKYEQKTGIEPNFYICEVVNGAEFCNLKRK